MRLKGQPFLNPALARALEEQFQITLDADSFVALAVQNGAFKPQPVIDRLRGLTSHLPAFAVQPRLVVSSFAEVGRALAEDAEHLDHLVIEAIAGNPTAKWGVGEAYAPVDPIPQDQRPPVTVTLLLDADPEQDYVIAQINAGNSLVVTSLPGTGGTQTIVNSIGCLVAQNKRVLVVSPRASSLKGIGQRLADVGLPGLAVAPKSLKRDVVQSIVRNEKDEHAQTAEVDDALVRLRHVLLDYRFALGRPDRDLGVSVLDALGELSRLALLPDPPATTARLTREAVVAIAHDRASAAASLVKAASLGEFRYGPRDSPWYGATSPRAPPRPTRTTSRSRSPPTACRGCSSAPTSSSARRGCAPTRQSTSSACTCASSSTCARRSTSSSPSCSTGRSARSSRPPDPAATPPR